MCYKMQLIKGAVLEKRTIISVFLRRAKAKIAFVIYSTSP